MSFDHLQQRIKTLKCPLAVELTPGEGESPEVFLPWALALTDALEGVVPALRFPLGAYLPLGWRGVKLMEDLLSHAREKGFFTLLDAPLCALPPTNGADFPADCLIVSDYLGSDALAPLLEALRKSDKCLFVLARSGNASAFEFQDLVAGDRLVYQVAGDLAQRLSREDLGQLGYARTGIVVEGAYPSDLRKLRTRWERNFLLVSGPAGDARFAFDRYGRGALVSTAEPLLAARAADPAQAPEAARAKAEHLRDELKQYITIL